MGKKVTVLCALGLMLLYMLVAEPVRAQQPDPQDPDSNSEESTITKLLGIVFPTDSLKRALEDSTVMILQGAFDGIGAVYRDALAEVAFGQYVTGPPMDAVKGVWTSVLYVSMALWPVTLALAVLPAARSGVDSAASYADIKYAVMEWVAACAGAAMSLFVLNWCMRLATTLAGELFRPGWPVIAEATAHMFTDSVLLGGISTLIPGSAIFILVFIIILGLTFLVGLYFAFLARYVILYVLIAIAPLVLTLGCVSPTRWLVWLWLKGIVLALLLYPANAIMLRIIFEMEASGALLVRLLTVVGVLSVLIALNTAVASAVFAAATAIAKRAKETTEGIIARAMLAVGGVLLGAAALGGTGLLSGTPAVTGGADGAVIGAAGGATGVADGAAQIGSVGGAAKTAGADGAAKPSGADGATSCSSSAMTSTGTGAAKVRAALNDPTVLRRLGNVARVVGRGISMVSRGPIGHAMGVLTEGAGFLAGDIGNEREQALRERYPDEHRFLAAQGLDPHGKYFYDLAGTMRRLTDEYGGNVQGRYLLKKHGALVASMMAAAEARGTDLQTLAAQAGYSSPGQMFGALIEDGIRGSGFVGRQPYFPLAALPKSASWQAGVLTPEDWVRGMQTASRLGRAGGAEDLAVYAEMAHALRGRGGSQAIDEMARIAQNAHARTLGGGASHAWPIFAQEMNSLAARLGVEFPQAVRAELDRLARSQDLPGFVQPATGGV